jgi:cytosine/adenosine deaminase-related metal-dependent hydrolase
MDGRRQLRRTDVVAGQGLIAAVARAGASPGLAIDDTEAVVAPGLVLGHVHLDQVLLDRGFVPSARPGGLERQLQAWARGETPETRALQARLGLTRALASGVTTVVDASTRGDRGAVIDAALAYGLRVVAPVDVTEVEPEAALAPLLERYAPAIERGRVHLALWVGDAERTPLARLRRAARWAERHLVVAHVGRRPRWLEGGVMRLRLAGLLGPGTILTPGRGPALRGHARLLADAGASVVVTPGADVVLGAPSPVLRPLLDAGVDVGLGLGGGWARHGFDVFAALRLVRRQLSAEGHAAPASQALELATRGLQRVLARGLGARVGQLDVGTAADVIVVDLAGPPAEAHEALAWRIVEQGSPSDVRRAFVAGIRVMTDGVPELEGAPSAEAVRAARAALAGAPVRDDDARSTLMRLAALFGPRWPGRALSAARASGARPRAGPGLARADRRPTSPRRSRPRGPRPRRRRAAGASLWPTPTGGRDRGGA